MTKVELALGRIALDIPRFLLTVTLLLSPSGAKAQLDETTKQLSRDIFKQLIEINTTESVGNVTTAAEAMAERFREAGFPARDIYVGGPSERKKNLVVRIHGSGKHKPVLLIGHLDVVEARREEWTTDPFQFVEKDGYFYGRGGNSANSVWNRKSCDSGESARGPATQEAVR